jgi:arginase
VSAPVPGGPSREEARLCMGLIAQTGRVASLDVVELNPTLDDHLATAAISVELITALLSRQHRF